MIPGFFNNSYMSTSSNKNCYEIVSDKIATFSMNYSLIEGAIFTPEHAQVI